MGQGGPARRDDNGVPIDALRRVPGLADDFYHELVADLEPGDHAGRMILLRRAIDCLDLRYSEAAASAAPCVAGEKDDPVLTVIDWQRHACKVQFGVAADRLNVGEQMPKLEKSVEAVRQGDIGLAHLSVMARLLTKVPRSVDIASLEGELLEQAKKSTPGRFWHFTKRVLHALNAELVAAGQRFQAEERWLRFTDMEDGSVALSGRLDSMGAATVKTMLEPLSRRMGEGDDRCHERRQGDGIVEGAMMLLDSGRLPSIATQRPHLQVTTTLETLCGKPGAPAADMEFSEPISTRTVQRLACDASIARVVFGAGSIIVDAGRARRVVSSATRRALNARDRHCQWPGCERPAGWSAAHHLVHWVEGGLTDLSNLILLCHRHHWAVHEGGWKLARASDDRLLVIPPAYNYRYQPRAPDKPAAA